MIVDIQKGPFAKGLIEYHEKKVKEGRATLLLDNTLSGNTEERVAAFNETAALNKRVYRNKFVHFSFAFNIHDPIKNSLTDPETKEKILKIAERYLEKMGYTNNPILIYQHQDTAYTHFHVVTTSMSLDGTKVPELNDFKKSQDISRQIEKDYGLVPTVYIKQEERQLNELNAKQFKVLNGLKKAEKDPEFIAAINKILDKEDGHSSILQDSLSDYRIQQLFFLRDNRKEAIFDIYRLLKKHDLLFQTDKEKLMDRLSYVKSISISRDDFEVKAQAQGLYVRKIATGPDTYSFTYGLPEKNFYVKEKQLPLAYRWNFLFTDKTIDKPFDRESQRKYLHKIVRSALRHSSSKDDFEKRLFEKNIDFEYAVNKRGIYGIRFKSLSIKDSISFKGSELSKTELSWTAIAKMLNIQEVKISKEKESKTMGQEPGQVLPRSISKTLDTSNDDPEETRKRGGGFEVE